MWKKIQKQVLEFFLQPVAKWYLSKDRIYQYKNLVLQIKSGVFHPGFFFSTKVFVKFLMEKELRNKSILELGAGSGLISLVAAGNGAVVMSTDISLKAIENLKINSELNNLPLKILHSDLFDNIPSDLYFDFIIINPPYYPRNPKNEPEKAWFCGENFEYFQSLFSQLCNRVYISHSNIYMILSEDCQISEIQKLARQNDFQMIEIYKKKTLWEWNFIFQLQIK